MQCFVDRCCSFVCFPLIILLYVLRFTDSDYLFVIFKSQCVCKNSIKAFYFSTIYTIIPHTLLQSGIQELIQRCISKKNGKERYQYLVIGRDKSSFVKIHSKSNNKYKKDEIIQMLDFFLSTTYLSCLVDGCFNKRLVFQWV